MRALVVDDDPVTRALIAEVLTRRGYETRVCPGGAEAVAAVAALGAAAGDLLVLRWPVPGADGAALCQRAQAAGPDPASGPTILALVGEEEGGLAEALGAGVDDYIPYSRGPLQAAALEARLAVVEQAAASRAALAAARQGEAALRTVVANVPLILFALDAAGVFTLSEGRGLAALGLQPGQVVGLSAFDVYRAEPRIVAGLRRALAGEEWTDTTETDGVVFDARYVPLRDAAGEVQGIIGIGTDITQRTRAERALRASEARLALQYAATTLLAGAASVEQALPALLETLCRHGGWQVGLYWAVDVDGDGGALRCRAVWQRSPSPALAGLSPAGGVAALSETLSVARGVGLPGRVWASHAPAWASQEPDGVDDGASPRARAARADGLRTALGFPVLVAGVVQGVVEVYGPDGDAPPDDLMRALGVIGLQVGQFMERKRAEEALAQQALHDALTGLPNRALLLDQLHRALRAAAAAGTPLAFFLLDLDHFKEVNDTLGHHVGDLLLHEVGRRVGHALRTSDLVARLGGDEFAVLLPEADADGAAQVAHKILAALEEPLIIEGQRLALGGSIGGALFPRHGTDSAALLRRADVAMYVAKGGGGGYALYDEAHDQHSVRRLGLLGDLRAAIEADAFTVYYQPQVDLAHGRLRGVEALLRWPHPQHGLLAPDQFIPLAEQSGAIVPLTYGVLRTALRQVQEWGRHGLRLGVAVNVSARGLHDPPLVQTIAETLRQYEVAPGALTLEITESVLLERPQEALAVLTRLADLGVRLSIDDFGTGYSSLAYLTRLPVHEIKVDRSFVSGLADGGKDAAVVRAVIELGHTLGMAVVAEGVEDAATLAVLEGLGCETAQGYHIARPLPAADVERWCAVSPWGQGERGGRGRGGDNTRVPGEGATMARQGE